MKAHIGGFISVDPAHWGVALLFTGLLAMGAWSYLAEVEEMARASGQVIASARTQLIQSVNEGVLDKLLVVEGQKVKQGELLAQLDRHQAETALAESRGKVAALKAALVRLHSEVLGRQLEFPDDVKQFPAFVSNQTELYQRRQRALSAELDMMNALLRSAKEELAMSEPLLHSGDIARTEIIRLQKSILEISGQMVNRRNKFLQDAQAEMTKAEEDLATQEQVLAERLANLERTAIVASADGVVRNIRITTLGAKVRPGDIVMDLLPTDGALIVEAKLKPADIAFVRAGLPAAVKLDAYDYSIYGALQGKVRFVSPDALTEDTRTGEHIYYRVQIAIDEALLAQHSAAKPIAIQPGMTAQIDIRTGSRTVLTYLTKPMTKTLAEAFRER